MIIGIAGKVGSGKTFVAEQLSKQTGYKHIKLDYQAAEAANVPILKWLLQKRLKIKIPKAYEGIQLFPLLRNLEKPFSNLEFWLFKSSLNRRLKKLMRTNDSMIIDFVALPMLTASKKFDKMLVIESDNEKRIRRLAERDGLTTEQVRKMDSFIDKYCNFNGLTKVRNDYIDMVEFFDHIAIDLNLIKR